MPRRHEPVVATDAARRALQPMAHPDQARAVVDLRRAEMTSPVVQIESAHPAALDAVVPRRAVERAADDLHLDAGLATGDIDGSGFTRYAPSWDWLITQAHAATVNKPDPYGDLAGVRKAF